MEQLEKQILKAIPVLKEYEKLIQKWQKAINLVSQKEVNDLWQRHILDSAQVYFYLTNEAKTVIDMGSGGGFPAIVLGVLNTCFNGPIESLYMIESDARKCVFLEECVRVLGLKNCFVINNRLEKTPVIQADVITARGLACVEDLLMFGERFAKQGTIYLLLKGEKVDQELKEIDSKYKVQKLENRVNKKGCVLKIREGEIYE